MTWGRQVKLEFLGDSYDIVKQSLLRWLASMGPWATHPLFTDSVPPQQVDAYAQLLGTRVLSRDVLTSKVVVTPTWLRPVSATITYSSIPTPGSDSSPRMEKGHRGMFSVPSW